jgi:hypothetical protein
VRVLISAILFLMIGASPALAWHDAGHRKTATIAFDAMTAKERQTVIGVLLSHPRIKEDFQARMPDSISSGTTDDQGRWLLGQASIWPDLVKTLDDDIRREFNRSQWHYINAIVYLSDEDEAAFGGSFDHNMSTIFEPPLRQNLNIIQALRGNLIVWRSDTASETEKAVALCWVLHLTGDLHQPLHNVALFSKPYFPSGDRGGNSIDVVWEEGTRNLHAVWDGLPTTMADLEPSARTLLTIETDTIDDAALDEWLGHHAGLARMFVYPSEVKTQLLGRLSNGEVPQIEVSREYLIRARSVVRRQVNLAGHRIAAFLTATD